MSLQQHLEYTTNKLLEEVKARREKQLSTSTAAWDEKLSKLEHDYKLKIEDEVARELAFHRFNEKRHHDDELSQLEKHVLDQLYQKSFEKMLSDESFLKAFVESFIKKLAEHPKLEWDVYAYGHHAKKLAHLAEAHGKLKVELKETSSKVGGLQAISKEFDIEADLEELLIDVKEASISSVAHLIFS